MLLQSLLPVEDKLHLRGHEFFIGFSFGQRVFSTNLACREKYDSREKKMMKKFDRSEIVLRLRRVTGLKVVETFCGSRFSSLSLAPSSPSRIKQPLSLSLSLNIAGSKKRSQKRRNRVPRLSARVAGYARQGKPLADVQESPSREKRKAKEKQAERERENTFRSRCHSKRSDFRDCGNSRIGASRPRTIPFFISPLRVPSLPFYVTELFIWHSYTCDA